MTNKAIGRRNFLKTAALAGAGAKVLGGTAWGSQDHEGYSGTFDLLVVGAGIAGIAAARIAQSYGGRVLVLEAQPYIGGRAFTDNTTFPEIPFDRGAQFFQQVISGNDLLQIAQAFQIPVSVVSDFSQQFYKGSKSADDADVARFLATTLEIKAAIFAVGGLAQGNPADDQSIAATIGGLSREPFYNVAVGLNVLEVTGTTARSTIDLYNFMLVSPLPFGFPGDAYLIKSGMGNFISSLAKGLQIKLDTTVQLITTSGDGVTVTARGQTFFAKTMIVTASSSVLAAGGIEFNPPLPPAYTQAFADLPLANIYKCLLGFKTAEVFRGIRNMTFVVPLGNEDAPTFVVRFWKTNNVEVIANGDMAYKLETMGPAKAARTLLAALDKNFPGASADFDGRISPSAWTTNPFTRGAYSAALPGQVGARSTIAQPIGNQLWFAGEAVAPLGAHSSLHGAFRTGLAAGSAAMRVLGLA